MKPVFRHKTIRKPAGIEASCLRLPKRLSPIATGFGLSVSGGRGPYGSFPG
ncbi:hypothetical protein OHAE_2513 [Ochrobactrum soli]|uniref:Uncharacterized protein n=1 Tax=Ochrobactrum soli TaxID=2448455 RepID=A0A2P9HR90_9HYPH|nr:hypothetical protein OHAE_2513 [[Ochrobactrum] soli]